MKTKIISFLMVTSFALVACQGSMPSKQTSGAVLGGVAGGVAGTQIGKGRGRDVAIVTGTLLGAALGGVIGSSMDTTDQLAAERALEDSPTGQSVSWTNPDTSAKYTMTPTRTFSNSNGQDCREFTTVAIIEGKKEEISGKACREPDGTWKTVK